MNLVPPIDSGEEKIILSENLIEKPDKKETRIRENPLHTTPPTTSVDEGMA